MGIAHIDHRVDRIQAEETEVKIEIARPRRNDHSSISQTVLIVLCDRKANTLPSVFWEKQMFLLDCRFTLSLTSGVSRSRHARHATQRFDLLLASDLTWRVRRNRRKIAIRSILLLSNSKNPVRNSFWALHALFLHRSLNCLSIVSPGLATSRNDQKEIDRDSHSDATRMKEGRDR